MEKAQAGKGRIDPEPKRSGARARRMCVLGARVAGSECRTEDPGLG